MMPGSKHNIPGAGWLLVGFIHGVMNTDNPAVTPRLSP